MSFAPGSIVGQYRICELLGSGAGGRVFAVEHLVTGRREAMKVLLHGEAERFLREAHLQAGLDHPNIVKVLNAFHENDHPVIVMELVEGESLEARLSRERMSLETALSFARQALDALQYAHGRGVTHRDIKPSNMLIAPGGALKLTDFGLAKAATDARLTQTGALLGSPYYMSPEQVQSALEVDFRSDIYSLGVVLYEMATGRKPFDDATPFALMLSHLERTPAAPRSVDVAIPPALNSAILRAMKKSPAERFQSAAEFKQAIDRSALHKSPHSRRFAAVGLAVAGIFAAGLMLPKRPSPQPPVKSEVKPASPQAARPIARKKQLTVSPPAPAPTSAPAPSIRPSGMVWAVALSPDGRLLATGGESRVVELWETSTGRRSVALRGHASGVTTAAFSADGTSLITGDADGATKLWDLTANTQRGDFPQPGFINHVAISDNGAWIASASSDKRVRVWNLLDGNVIHDLRAFKNEPSALAFNPSGSVLAAIASDRVLRIWNLSRNQAIPRQPLIDRGVNAVAFSPDGERVALAGSGRVRVFDLRHRDQIGAIEAKGPRQALVFTTDGRCLAADSVSGAVIVWDVYTAHEICRHATAGRLRAMAFSRDGKRLAVAVEGGPVTVGEIN